MKVCEACGEEIWTKDGENRCVACEDREGKNPRKRGGLSRRDREAILRSCGLVKVRGALGGTYWE